jgi:hypothetical protein
MLGPVTQRDHFYLGRGEGLSGGKNSKDKPCPVEPFFNLKGQKRLCNTNTIPKKGIGQPQKGGILQMTLI